MLLGAMTGRRRRCEHPGSGKARLRTRGCCQRGVLTTEIDQEELKALLEEGVDTPRNAGEEEYYERLQRYRRDGLACCRGCSRPVPASTPMQIVTHRWERVRGRAGQEEQPPIHQGAASKLSALMLRCQLLGCGLRGLGAAQAHPCTLLRGLRARQQALARSHAQLGIACCPLAHRFCDRVVSEK